MGDLVKPAVFGEDKLPLAETRLWIDAARDETIGFELYRTNKEGKIERARAASGAPLMAAKYRVFAISDSPFLLEPPPFDSDMATKAAKVEGRPKAFLKIGENGRAEIFADAKPDALQLLQDAKSAGLLSKLDGYAENA